MSEPIWIEDDLVLAIHDRLLAEHGGGEGVRDESLLQSAPERIFSDDEGIVVTPPALQAPLSSFRPSRAAQPIRLWS